MILTRSPSNIALVKYMGKEDPIKNLPSNPSLSMTLDSLCTYFEIEPVSESELNQHHRQGLAQLSSCGRLLWMNEGPLSPLDSEQNGFTAGELRVPDLSDEGFQKVARHMARVVEALRPGFPFFWKLRSANTFPAASGVASSASSFSAMTLAAAAACSVDPLHFRTSWDQDPRLVEVLTDLSRQGSGSSCRSFYGPWVSWDRDQVRSVRGVRLPPLVDFVVLIDSGKKKVSSSEAHLRIKSSPLWEKRPARVAERIAAAEGALVRGDLKSLSQIAWAELWEMHSLFHTSEVPFTYWEGATLDGLNRLKQSLHEEAPPIITLDAGPNLHILVPQSSCELWKVRLRELFPGREILLDRASLGPRVLCV